MHGMMAICLIGSDKLNFKMRKMNKTLYCDSHGYISIDILYSDYHSIVYGNKRFMTTSGNNLSSQICLARDKQYSQLT